MGNRVEPVNDKVPAPSVESSRDRFAASPSDSLQAHQHRVSQIETSVMRNPEAATIIRGASVNGATNADRTFSSGGGRPQGDTFDRWEGTRRSRSDSSSGSSSDRNERSDQQCRQNRQDRADQQPDRTNRQERQDLSSRQDRSDRADQQDRSSRHDRQDRPDPQDRFNRHDRQDRPDQHDRFNRQDRGERPEHQGKPNRPDQQDKPNSAQQGKPNLPESGQEPPKPNQRPECPEGDWRGRDWRQNRQDGADNEHRPNRFDRQDRQDRQERPGKPDRNERHEHCDAFDGKGKPDRKPDRNRDGQTEVDEKHRPDKPLPPNGKIAPQDGRPSTEQGEVPKERRDRLGPQDKGEKGQGSGEPGEHLDKHGRKLDIEKGVQLDRDGGPDRHIPGGAERGRLDADDQPGLNKHVRDLLSQHLPGGELQRPVGSDRLPDTKARSDGDQPSSMRLAHQGEEAASTLDRRAQDAITKFTSDANAGAIGRPVSERPDIPSGRIPEDPRLSAMNERQVPLSERNGLLNPSTMNQGSDDASKLSIALGTAGLIGNQILNSGITAPLQPQPVGRIADPPSQPSLPERHANKIEQQPLNPQVEQPALRPALDYKPMYFPEDGGGHKTDDSHAAHTPYNSEMAQKNGVSFVETEMLQSLDTPDKNDEERQIEKGKEFEQKDKKRSESDKTKDEPEDLPPLLPFGLAKEQRRKYIVKEGDTLSSIAIVELKNQRLCTLIYSINSARLSTAPGELELSETSPLIPGTVLLLPTSQECKSFIEKFEQTEGSDNVLDVRTYRVRYNVRLGDSLRSIATKHPALRDSSLWELIAIINGLPTDVGEDGQPSAAIYRGSSILIPSQNDVENFLAQTVTQVSPTSTVMQ